MPPKQRLPTHAKPNPASSSSSTSAPLPLPTPSPSHRRTHDDHAAFYARVVDYYNRKEEEYNPAVRGFFSKYGHLLDEDPDKSPAADTSGAEKVTTAAKASDHFSEPVSEATPRTASGLAVLKPEDVPRLYDDAKTNWANVQIEAKEGEELDVDAVRADMRAQTEQVRRRWVQLIAQDEESERQRKAEAQAVAVGDA